MDKMLEAIHEWIYQRRSQLTGRTDPEGWLAITPRQKMEILRDVNSSYRMRQDLEGTHFQFMGMPVLVLRENVPVDRWLLRRGDICDVRGISSERDT